MNATARLVTASVVFGAIYLGWRYGNSAHDEPSVDRSPAILSTSANRSSPAASPSVDGGGSFKVKPAVDTKPAVEAKRPEPEEHQAELDAAAGQSDFPESFLNAVARGDETLAGGILQLRFSRVPQTSAAIYAFLQPYMTNYHFLWQRPILVDSFVSACAGLPTCDRKAAIATIRQENPEYYQKRASCLDSWTLLIPLAQHLHVPPPAASLAEIDRGLDACLAENSGDPNTVMDQVDFYLFYLKHSLGASTANARAEALAKRFPSLPIKSSR